MKAPTRIIIPLILVCCAIVPQAGAICQEGCFGFQNTVLGDDAFLTNTGGDNTAIGFEVLMSNTFGGDNTAVGFRALWRNTTGNLNTAIGTGAMLLNTAGYQNTAVGVDALTSNMTGFNNLACGHLALGVNTTGSDNTAVGVLALERNTIGKFNIAVGRNAGINLSTGSYNIDIGNDGVAGDFAVMRLGTEFRQTTTYIAGIRQTPLAQGAALAVGITSTGQLGVRASSERFKEGIKPMDKTSESILALKPVSFRYKKEFDPKGAPQFGLVAEEVAKVSSDLVVADDQGKPFTVRYDEVNAMLLNEFLKEHKKVEEQASKIQQLESALKDVTARLDAKGL